MENFKTISNNYLSVTVNTHGSTLSSIRSNSGTEYLWQGSPDYWDAKDVTIFPYIARMTEKSYYLNGQKYQMNIHGFAGASQFEVITHDQDVLTLHIKETEETLQQYPYHFDFYVTYRLIENTLSVEYTVTNRENQTMYFGIGGHPGFNVPLEEGLSFEDYTVTFSEKSLPRQVVLSDDCFIMDGQFVPFPLVQDQTYALHHGMFDNDAIVLTDMPRQITLASDKGTKKVTVSYPDMPYLGLWHWPKSDAPYMCIEPWSSLPSRKGIIEDLAAQDNLLSLPAGETYRNTWSVTITD